MLAIDKPGTVLTKEELLEKLKESNHKIIIYSVCNEKIKFTSANVLGVAYDLNGNMPIELVLETSNLGVNSHIDLSKYLLLGDGFSGFAFLEKELEIVNEYFDPNAVLERTIRRRLTEYTVEVFNLSTYKQMSKAQKIKVIKEVADAAIKQIEVNNEEN